MQVVAISTPRSTGWQWRIVTYTGEVIEESQRRFPTIGRAVAEGQRRLRELDLPSGPLPPSRFSRSTSYLRSPGSAGGRGGG